MKLRNASILAAGMLSLAAVSAQAGELKPFKASYRATYNNMAANATMSLAPAGGNRWTYAMNVQNALVQLNRSSTVDASGAQLRPVGNRETINMVIKKKTKQGSFDWSSGQASWSGDVKADRKGPIKLQAGDVDGMTLNLAIVRDALAGKPMRYRLIENGKAKPLTFSNAGKESVTVEGKPMQAIKVSGNDGGNHMTLWVVDGIPVPVRIQQREDDGDTIDLRLQSVN